MTVDQIESLSDSIPDSNKTLAQNILFFYSTTTGSEAIKKLKNHNFKIGYSYDIDICGENYVRIVGYNAKNDIFRGWLRYDESYGNKLVFPDDLYKFPSLLTLCRYVDLKNEQGKVLKVFRQNCHQAIVKSLHKDEGFSKLDYIQSVDNISFYGNYLPILENPDIELYRRLESLSNEEQRTFYSDVAYLCNIYKFKDTYDLLDEGLKKIYNTLYLNYEKKFCEEMNNNLNDPDLILEVLKVLNIDIDEIKLMFERNGYVFEYKNEDNSKREKSFVKKFLSKFVF